MEDRTIRIIIMTQNLTWGCLLALLQVGAALQLVSISHYVPASQANSVYFFLEFSHSSIASMKQYNVIVAIGTVSQVSYLSINSETSTVGIYCKIDRDFEPSMATITFYNIQDSSDVQRYTQQLFHLYYFQNQRYLDSYWAIMRGVSLWMGYFLLAMLLLNSLTYCLPLLRALQLTSVYILLNVRKPALLDAVLAGVFNLSTFQLYSLYFQSPFQLPIPMSSSSIYGEVGVDPTFIGSQYSPLMQLNFLLIGVFVFYVVVLLVRLCFKNLLKYFVRRLIQDIFINSTSIYFTMHIPIGLTSVVGFKFGNYNRTNLNLTTYAVNVLSLFIVLSGPVLFTILLSTFKKIRTVRTKKGYLFASRAKELSEVFVLLDLLRDVLFCISVVLFPPHTSLAIMLVYIVVETLFICKSNVFPSKLMLGLKLLEQLFYLIFTLFLLVYYTLEVLGTNISTDALTKLGNVSFVVLVGIYLTVTIQTLVKVIKDIRNWCRKSTVETEVATCTILQHTCKQITTQKLTQYKDNPPKRIGRYLSPIVEDENMQANPKQQKKKRQLFKPRKAVISAPQDAQQENRPQAWPGTQTSRGRNPKQNLEQQGGSRQKYPAFPNRVGSAPKQRNFLTKFNREAFQRNSVTLVSYNRE